MILVGGAIVVVIGVAVTVLGRAVVGRVPPGAPDRWLRLLASLSDEERREWFSAMSVEIDAIDDPAAKRRFAWGCVRATFTVPLSPSLSPSPDPSGLFALGVVAAGVAGCLASAAFGLVHYPTTREGLSAIAFAIAFLAALAIYGVTGLVVVRLGSKRARRSALALAAPALVTSTVAALGPGMLSAGIGFGVVLLPGVAAYRAARFDHRWSSGLAAGVTCAVLAGMLTFIGFTVATYLAGGGSPTVQMLDEFHRSGISDYSVWVIDDNLGGAVVMLALLPAVGVAVATLGAALGLQPPPVLPRVERPTTS